MLSDSQRNMEQLILTTVLSLTLGSAAPSGPSPPPVVIAVLYRPALLPCGSSPSLCEEYGAPHWTFVNTDAVVSVLQTEHVLTSKVLNRFELQEDGSLKINSVRIKDAGRYHCARTHGDTHTVSLSVVSAVPNGKARCSLVSPEKDRFSLRSELKLTQRRGSPLLVPQSFYQAKRLHCTVLDQLTGDQTEHIVQRDIMRHILDVHLTSSAAAVVTTVTVTVAPDKTRETPLSSIRLREDTGPNITPRIPTRVPVVFGLVAAVGPALVILALVKVWCRCRKANQTQRDEGSDVSHMFQVNDTERVVYSSVIMTRAS